MLIFLDESFRTNRNTNAEFGVLAGVAIPEDIFHEFQLEFFKVRRPFHDVVLREDQEIHGKELLGKATLKQIAIHGDSNHWRLASLLLDLAVRYRIRVFGVVCFRPSMKSFVCANEATLDTTFRYLFERIDNFMKLEFPGRTAKLIFDNREHRTHEANARAITNFFVKSAMGRGFDSLLRIPLFAVSQGHNYGLQLADLVTTAVALHYQGAREFDPFWQQIQGMVYKTTVGGWLQESIKVMRQKPEAGLT
ncbi:hypothetical protein Pan44_19710 [Caulifigura coniformis]|uniref:DUF3800 domain-containing protein n=1 Tax=Caulifigura coniformis TaxID=2527983 RepID=A0A517SCU3_9PLAN|nr:DUF3800 domain-containing protein [Caulifigura coniformis]QDT53944.1 hypothetical protein Pan44_19710 [Caulifigura coniformis]